jgi:hypothetical protein
VAGEPVVTRANNVSPRPRYDGWLDLFVASYSVTKSILYHNGGPPAFTLTPVPASPAAAVAGNWVGSGWGDNDNDGALSPRAPPR